MKIGLALMRMRVRGGMERDCLAIGRALAARGHDVHLLTTEPQYAQDAAFAVREIHVPRYMGPRRLAAFAEAIRELRKHETFDAVISFGRVVGCEFHYAAELPFRRRGFPFSWLPRVRTYGKLEAAIHSPSAPSRTIFYLTERQREAYRALYGDMDQRSCVIPVIRHDDRPVPAKFYAKRENVRRKLAIPANAPLAVLVATKPLKKGLLRILAAMPRFPSLHLLVVGASRNAQWKLAELIHRVGDRVHCVPYSDEVMDLIGAADFMVHPSDEDSAGLAIVEGLSSGIPVIVTENCGYADLVVRLDAGLVIPVPFQGLALSSAIEGVIGNLDRMKGQAREAAMALNREPSWTDEVANAVERLGLGASQNAA